MIPYPHVTDLFMENYRLLHITWNNPPHAWLMYQTTRDMQEWEQGVVLLKIMGTGKAI